MAETRLPDVVPAKDLAASGKEIGELESSSVSNQQCCDSDSSADQQQSSEEWQQPKTAPIVQIWSGSNSPVPDELVQVSSSCLDDIEPHRSASQLSDSGIDSQLASPTVIDGYNKLQEQSFVLDLSATHLSVPSRLRPGSLQSCQDKQHPLKEDEPIHNSEAVENIVHGDDPSPACPTGFLPQKRHHRHFLPVDLDGCWQQQPRSDQKIRSLPSESVDQQMEVDESRLPASWSDSSAPITSSKRNQQTSPQICVDQHDIHQEENSGLEDHSLFSERSGSLDSNESSHFLADPETDLGSYCSSRKPSFSSVRSESAGTENIDRRTVKQPTRQHLGMGLSRSSSSRSTFLSVPSRVPNSVWPSTSEHPAGKSSERLPSLHSQMGSTSSLMASSPYLRLGLTEAGINEALLASMAAADGTDRYVVDMFDDPYYERAAAAAAQLSLTQRLAFPQLVESDPEAGNNKPHSRYQQRNELPREESSLNFFAKIITFLVLVFVIVLVVGVLVKISHTPR